MTLASLPAPLWEAAAAATLTVLLVPPLRRLARRHRLTDEPAAHKPHASATPYLGGVGIALGVLIPVGLFARSAEHRWQAIIVGAVAVCALGLVDDLGNGLSARLRLAVETALATGVVVAGARPHLTGQAWLDGALTVGWIVVVTNAYNLLDNCDGALAITACATATPLAALLFAGGAPAIGTLLACLAAASAGFLLYNAPPARIFMGDAGSLFIGFLIASGAAAIPTVSSPWGTATVLLLVGYPAAVDTTLVTVSRLRARRPIWQGGTDHAAHRLRRAGLGPRSVLVVLLTATALSTLTAVLVYVGSLPSRPTLVVALLAVALPVMALLHIPADDAPHPHPVDPPKRPVGRPPARLGS